MVKYNYNEPYYKIRFGDIENEKLKIISFKGEESISDLFKYSFELLSTDPEIDAAKILNKKAVFEISRGDEDPISIHGIISEFEQRGSSHNYVSYHAVLVPALWRLKLTFRNEVYQNLDIEELVTKVLTDSGMSNSDFKFDLLASYPKLEYVVQYRETNLDFIKRKLEHFGIFFYFNHSNDKDVIVFIDSNDKLNKIDKSEDLYYSPNRDPRNEIETINEFTCKESIVTGVVKLKDYNYMYPEKQVIGESNIDSDSPGTFYDYGDNFKDEKEAEFLAKVRNQEIIAQSKIYKGTSDCRLLQAGNIFKIQKHYRDSWNSEYIVIKITSSGTQRSLFGLLPSAKKIRPTYINNFTAIPIEINYRPQRTTPIPKVSGIMSAKVESSSGDEYASMDDQGRYRAKMLFDLSDNTDGEASPPIRMSQPYSGAGYGMHFPNHAGTELLWACVDGNVDRPIGLGTAPNPSNTSPSTSGNKSQGIIRTAGNNEISLDDVGGKEQITIKQECGNKIVMDAEGPNIEITQKCGNEILMRETEGIQIRDKFGNEIVMDSEAGTMKLRSPSHESVIELGKSILEDTLSDLKQVIKGNHSNIVHGQKKEHVVGPVKLKWDGINAKIHGGLVSDTFIGAKHSFFSGLKMDQNYSRSISYTRGKKTTKCDASETEETVSKEIEATDLYSIKVGDSSLTLKKDGTIEVKCKKFDISATNNFQVHSGSSKFKIDGKGIGAFGNKVDILKKGFIG
ncbi:MAG: type VI secretion system tip protein TssI/VgrG [Melioribacteraceae bacterium]